MKKVLLTSILGLAASVATSFGQGAVQFDNYANNGGYGAIVTFDGTGGSTAGAPVTGFTASMFYVLGNQSSVPTTGTPLATTPVNGGFFTGGSPAMPNYVSGVVTVDFVVSGTFGGKPFLGSTGPLVVTPATGVATPPYVDFPAFSVSVVPEPATAALAGLGAAAMLIFRRRK